MDRLRHGEAFPGLVTDDTSVFVEAEQRGQVLVIVEVVVPEPRLLSFQARLDAEQRSSQYSYGFPNGDGDCNCITWLERIGLPLLTGRMSEFSALPGFSALPRRRFGLCV
jgi:hypothetical protein